MDIEHTPLLRADAPIDTLCMACTDQSCDFKPMMFQRRPLGANDILIDMWVFVLHAHPRLPHPCTNGSCRKFCGVCHTDLHFAANHISVAGIVRTTYPCVPGHELAGIVMAVGAAVSKVKVGEPVGVGCMVDACLKCSHCKKGRENKCLRQVPTYQGKDLNGRAATYPVGGQTVGGYTTRMVVHEHFAIRIPKGYPLECAGPVMCSGVTVSVYMCLLALRPAVYQICQCLHSI